MEQIGKPKNHSCIYGQLIVGKGAKNAEWRKDNLYNKQCHKNWIST